MKLYTRHLLPELDLPANANQIEGASAAPLIHVLMVLIVLLIITFGAQHALRPGSPLFQARNTERKLVLVKIDAKGSVIWGDDTLSNTADLSARIAFAANQPVQPEIAVQPSPDTPYEFVARVLVLTKGAGLQKVGVLN